MLTTTATQIPPDPNLPIGPFRLAATGRGTLVLATDDALLLRPDPTEVTFRTVPLPWRPKLVTVSPSGRFAAAVSPTGNVGEVFDTTSGRSLLKLGDPGARRHSLVLGMMGTADGEVLLVSRQRSTLEVLSLPDGTTLSRADRIPPVPFVFGSLHPMLDGDTVVVIGHNESESKDSLLTLSLRAMADATEPGAATGPITDYAYRLAAGPCGHDAVVIYRDPEDDEAPDADDAAPTGELDDFHGLYVRRLSDGGLIERTTCDLPIESGVPLFGTRTAVLASARGVLLRVPIDAGSSAPTQLLHGVATALDNASGQAVCVSESGAVQILECDSPA